MVAAIDTYGTNMNLWRPPWIERSVSSGASGSFLAFGNGEGESKSFLDVHPNVTVCLEGGICEYSSIQRVVYGAPDLCGKVYVIYIKAGVYREIVRVGPSKMNLMLVGDGMDRTVITVSMNALQPGLGTYGSATFGVNADEFCGMGHNIREQRGATNELGRCPACGQRSLRIPQMRHCWTPRHSLRSHPQASKQISILSSP